MFLEIKKRSTEKMFKDRKQLNVYSGKNLKRKKLNKCEARWPNNSQTLEEMLFRFH